MIDLKKKLAIFIKDDIKNLSGTTRYISELSKNFGDFDITIFYLNRNKNDSLPVYNLGKLKTVPYNSFIIPIVHELFPMTYSYLKCLSKLRNFDTIYNTTPDILPTLLISMISQKFNKKFITSISKPRGKPLYNSRFRGLLIKPYTLLIRFALGRMPNMHTFNKEDYRYAINNYKKAKVYYIPHFVHRSDSVLKIQVNAKDFIVLYVGRLDTIQKGIDMLYLIADLVLIKNKHILFHIVGKGDGICYIKKLEEKYPKNVKYLGALDDNALRREYKQANLLLFPSRWEDFGLVLMEAQVFGLPAIAFNVRGPREIIKTKMQGELIKPFDCIVAEKEIIKKYLYWKDNKSNYLKNKKRMHHFIIKNYGVRVIVPKFRKMFMP